MDQQHLTDLRAVLDYAQPDEEHDWNLNPDNGAAHIVHAMRRLRSTLNRAEARRASEGRVGPGIGSIDPRPFIDGWHNRDSD